MTTTLHWLDFIAIGLYFVVLLWIGIRVVRREHGEGESESFLAADRNMGLVQTTASTAATDLGGGFSIAMGGLGFTLGVSGSWLIAISGLSVVMVSFLLVPKVKRWADRMRGLTTGDLFEARFDRRTGTLAALVIGIAWFTFVGGQVVAGAKLLQVTMAINLTLAVILSGAVILAYTAMGGLKAVIYTDVFQMIVLLIGIVFVAVPIGLYHVGGWSGIVEHFSANPDTISMVQWDAIGWQKILGWFFAIFPVWFISIAAMQRIVAARDVRTARLAFFMTGVPIEWPLFAIGSTLVGVIARMLLPDIPDPELATPMVIMHLLPVGVAGFVIAAYIAAVMSTADSVLMGPVAILTNDIYRKYLRPDADEKALVSFARAATLIIGTLGIALAYLVPNVLDLMLYAYTFGAAGLFFPMLGLLFWKGTTASGAFWSMICGGGSAIVWALLQDWQWLATFDWHPAWAQFDQAYGIEPSYAGWVIGLPVLVIVSLLTEHSSDENIEVFEK